MLVAGALALLIFVVAAIGALLALDLGRTEHRHWLDALKTWQQLIGAVLGFLGAAGVLVLSTALTADNDAKKSAAASHAIGFGLALEVERIGAELKFGKNFGATIDMTATPQILAQSCLNYSLAMQHYLLSTTPIYDAVLPRMVDFGDENLALFARFYGAFIDFRQGLKDVDQTACTGDAAGEIGYIKSQVNGGLKLYGLIAGHYEIAAAELGVMPDPAPSTSSPPSSMSP